MSGFAKATVTAFAAAGTAFAGLSLKALQLGGDLEQNIGGSEAVFGEFANTVQTVGAKAFETMGLAQSEYLATANKMGALMQGAGLDIETSMNLSTEAMQRAADVASIMGIDTTAAMESVAGAAKGNFTMMDNLGVAMNATTIEAYALSKGIDTSYASMDNATKVQLAMEMFLENTAYAAGNYAKENETLAGSLSTAKAALTNFLSGAGDADALVDSVSNVVDVVSDKLQELLPRLTTGLTTIVQKLIPKIPPLLAKMLPSIIEGAAALINGIVSALPQVISTLSNAMPLLVDAILTMVPLFTQSGIDILVALISGITSMLPSLIPTGVQAIMDFITAMLSSIPDVIESGVLLLQGLIDGIMSALPTLISALPDIIYSMLEFFTLALPDLIKMGVALLTSLIGDLPSIIEQIVAVLPTIIDDIIFTLTDLIPVIINAGIELFVALVAALPQIISTIVAALPLIITSIVGALLGSIDKLIDAGVQLFVALIENLPIIIVEILKAVPEIVAGIVTAFTELLPKIVEVGGNLIKGVWQGINDAGAWLKDKISGFFGGVVDSIKDFFGIKSPSTLFRDQIGKMLPAGMAEGIEDGIGVAISAAEKLANAVTNVFDGISFDPDINYMSKIEEALAIGDTELAKSLEAKRNAKIQGMGLFEYDTTDMFSDAGFSAPAALATSGVEQQSSIEMLLLALQDGFAMVADTILDALPDVLQFSINDTLMGEAIFNGVNRAARRQGTMGFVTREQIVAIARSVMPLTT